MRKVIRPHHPTVPRVLPPSLPRVSTPTIKKKQRRDPLRVWKWYDVTTPHTETAVGLTGFEEKDRTRMVMWIMHNDKASQADSLTTIYNPATSSYLQSVIVQPVTDASLEDVISTMSDEKEFTDTMLDDLSDAYQYSYSRTPLIGDDDDEDTKEKLQWARDNGWRAESSWHYHGGFEHEEKIKLISPDESFSTPAALTFELYPDHPVANEGDKWRQLKQAFADMKSRGRPSGVATA